MDVPKAYLEALQVTSSREAAALLVLAQAILEVGYDVATPLRDISRNL